MAYLVHAIGDFIQAIVGVFLGLFQTVFSVIHAAFTASTHCVEGAFSATEHAISSGLQLYQRAGFITANIAAVLVLSGLFYAYRLYSSPGENTGAVWQWPSEKQETQRKSKLAVGGNVE